MEKLYEQVLQVLGKSQDDPLFTKLIQALGESPEILSKSKDGTDFLFRKSGLQLCFYEGPKRFSSVFFHLGSAMVESGAVTRYHGDLPAGIQFGDSRANVELKLGHKPVSSKVIQGRTPEDPKDLWEDYDLKPFELRCMFRGTTDKLNSVSIHYAPANISASSASNA